MPPAMDLRIKENMSTRKKGKLPDNLYHFTSITKYRIILESGKFALTPSNLKFDPDTFHYEPIYFREQEIGMQAVNKYSNYHPVVWLTASNQVTAQNTGLSDDKLMCRINVKTDGRFWQYIRWRDFCDKYHADRFATSRVPITRTGTCVSRRFLWMNLPRRNFWIRTDFIKRRMRFQDSRSRMLHRNCLHKNFNYPSRS